tara:strand:- start:2127 stop:2306 length:180 start_codon:yes stop_codon:yes gene_type:complete
MKNSKPWYTSKAVLLGILMILAAVMEYVAGLPVGTTVVQAVSGVLMIVLRIVTKTGVTK